MRAANFCQTGGLILLLCTSIVQVTVPPPLPPPPLLRIMEEKKEKCHDGGGGGGGLTVASNCPENSAISLKDLSTIGGSPLIVPTGLVSLLHYIYSRIPIISKGTDSRVGVGFRFGPHADLQFLLELGPQEHTQSLGDPQNPAPCCGYDQPPGLQDVSNQLNVPSLAAAQRAGVSSGGGGGGGGAGGRPGAGGRGADKRKAPSGAAADWLGRWHEGVKGRAPRSHQQKSKNVVSTKNANSPLLTALQTFRDLWVAGRKAGKLH